MELESDAPNPWAGCQGKAGRLTVEAIYVTSGSGLANLHSEFITETILETVFY